VTISGREQAVPTCPTTRCFTVWDTGTVSLTVNGFTKNVGYAKPDTPATVATNLAAAFQGDANSPVSVSVSGSVLTLTAKSMGMRTNYALSASSGSNDTSDFGGPSFTVISHPTLTGGQDASTTPDAGTVSVTINSTTYTAEHF
jgi:phage tail sheath gpL-like